MKNNVIFILPSDGNRPIGGYKIVYEYANRLTSRGWQVSIGYDCRRVASRYNIWLPLKHLLVKIICIYRCWRYPLWFRMLASIRKFCIFNNNDIPATDNIVATAVGTVDLAYEKKECKRLYLIQGYETWHDWTENMVKDTYRLGLENIVIAKWLKNIVDDATKTNNSTLICNGVDNKEYYVSIPLANRSKKISMLYHKNKIKGSIYGIQTLIELKKIYPDLEAVLFGIPHRPKNLPSWIKYVQNATSKELHKIFNESQIYLYPTIEEGFGLTCVESMACGCALCITDYLGAHEFAVPEENSLMSPVKDVEAMVKNVCRLINDDKLRCNIAKNGVETAKKFNWDNSVDMFIEKLKLSC